jgi:hypothetical protein
MLRAVRAGEAGSGGVEADFGEVRGVVASEEIEWVILRWATSKTSRPSPSGFRRFAGPRRSPT